MKNHFSLDELLKLHAICVGNSINHQMKQREYNDCGVNKNLPPARRAYYRKKADELNEVIAEVNALSEKVWQLVINYTEL